LVIAIGVEGESADQFAVLSDDPDIGAGDQESDLAVLMGEADGDVAELAEVTEGDLSKGVDLVSTYAVVDGRWRSRGFGLDQGFENRHRGLAVEGAMGSDVVVVLAKGIELELQLSE